MKLEKVRTITGRIQVVTGLHIGASNESIEIGGLDNPIIKDPLPGSKAPYIPGSSLKGKLIMVGYSSTKSNISSIL